MAQGAKSGNRNAAGPHNPGTGRSIERRATKRLGAGGAALRGAAIGSVVGAALYGNLGGAAAVGGLAGLSSYGGTKLGESINKKLRKVNKL